MRKVLFILSLFCATVISCSNDNDSEGNGGKPDQTNMLVFGDRIDSLVNRFGTVKYDREVGLWYVYVSLDKATDQAKCFYLESIDESLRTEGLTILFSGNTYKLESPTVSSPSNLYCFAARLTNAMSLRAGEKSQTTLKAERQMTGCWKLVYEGIQQGKTDDYNTYAYLSEEGSAKYKKNAGKENETVTEGFWGVANDWVYDEDSQTMAGHMYSNLFGYNGYYSCTLRNDSLYFTPDLGDSYRFLVDPGLGFVRVK